MTTTNKAFIDAYRQSSTARQVRPLRGADLTDALAGTGEVVSATVDGDLVSMPSKPVTQPVDLPTSTIEQPRVDHAEAAPRRPLSAVQADELFGIDANTSGHCTPRWPESCQQLLASAADRYDAVLRKLPTESTSSLVGIVGAGPRSGCTTTAVCLALRSAALGFETALVDGNFTRSGLAATLEVDSYLSWAALLESDASVATAILSTDDCGVDLLLTDPLAAQRLESTSRFRASLAAGLLRRKYQRVFVDLGCPHREDELMVVDLAAAMGVDFLLAASTPSTDAAQIVATAAALDRFGLSIAGVIEAV